MFEEYIPKEEPGRAVIRDVFDWVESAMLALVCLVMVFTFFVRIAGVEGSSMLPTLVDSDRLLITRLGKPALQGDIVVITKPNRRNEPLVKRVIAHGGQSIDINFENGEVIVDGNVLREKYIADQTRLSYDMKFPLVVPEGHVFVMGDNRNDSWDSRDSSLGTVDSRHILGKALYRVAPYRDRGTLKSIS